MSENEPFELKNHAEIAEILSGAPLPIVYQSWDENPETGQHAPDLPYIAYYFESSDNMFADDRVYVKIERLVMELYTQGKDFEAEERFEAFLDLAEIPWEKFENRLDRENMYRIS